MNKSFVSFLLLFAVLGWSELSSQTTISQGDVSGTWTKAGSPYIVNGTITIQDGTKLTIEEGVTVEFSNYYAFVVQGCLAAVGTENDLITFTVSDTSGFEDFSENTGGWRGIVFFYTPETNDTSIFKHCYFEYAKTVGQEGGAIIISNYNKVKISNCTFYNNAVDASAHLSGGGGISVTSSTVKIEDCVFEKNNANDDYGSAISLKWSNGSVVKNNLFFDNYAKAGIVLIEESDSVEVTNNEFIENKINKGSLSIWYSDSIKISNNTFIKNEPLPYLTESQGIQVVESSALITNNSLYGKGNCGIETLGASYLEIYNCAFSNHYYPISILDDVTSTLIMRNCIFGEGKNRLLLGSGTIDTLNIFEGNPGFKNPGIEDFSLSNESPCINAGVNGSFLSATDILGNPRIYNDESDVVDIGAYEFAGQTSILGVKLSDSLIAENTLTKKMVGTFSVENAETGVNYSFSFYPHRANVDSVFFEISNDTLYASQPINYEEKIVDTLFITVLGDNGSSNVDDIQIYIQDVNEMPTDLIITADSVGDALPAGTFIGNISVIDEDPVNPLIFSLVPGDGSNDKHNDLFILLGDELKTGEKLEADSSYTIFVQADNDGLIFQKSLTIRCYKIPGRGLNPFAGEPREGAVSFVINDTLFIGLGSDASGVKTDFWMYIPETDLWYELDSFPGYARANATAFVLNNKAYVGLGRSAYPYSYYKDFFEFDPSTRDWMVVTPYPGSARYSAVEFTINDKAYVGTGRDADGYCSDFWEYEPISRGWTQIAELNADKRSGAVGFAIAGKGYVSGGMFFDSYSVQLSDVQEYDPITNTWTERIFADGINLSFNYASAIELGSKALICYGNKGKVVSYTPSSNEVEDLGDLAQLGENNRFYPISFILEDSAYIGLGSTGVMTSEYKNDIKKLAIEVGTNITDIYLSGTSIIENWVVGEYIGSFSTNVKDTEAQLVYSFVSGDGDEDNSLFTISEDSLLANASFNFEEKGNHSIRIAVTAPDGTILEKIFTIYVVDRNEPAYAMDLSNNQISEHAEIGTVIGSLSAFDEDAGDSHTFRITTFNGEQNFILEGNVLKLNIPLDYESRSEYNIRIEAFDIITAVYYDTFTIHVIDENDLPEKVYISHDLFMETRSVGDSLAEIVTTDPDQDDIHTYSLIAGDGTNDKDNDKFGISGNFLICNTDFDIEIQSEFNIYLRSTDQGGETVDSAFVVGIVPRMSIDQQKGNNAHVLVYPVPANKIVNISLQNNQNIKTIQQLNGYGQQIRMIEKINSSTYQLDVTSLENGVYILRIFNGERWLQKQIIIVN